MENKQKHKQQETKQIQRKFQTKTSKTDPLGSYTGKPEDPLETPVQDADDL